ncbi:M24 family metallopeptidase [Brevibacillus fluminis]|uniref:M24 family metallopeptidase n=1 Tax=Brevibacillus fluminis TaxID=511487 RepID=UPI003F8C1875
MSELFQNRVGALRAFMAEQGLDAAMVTNPINVYYLTGFRCNPHERFLALVQDNRNEQTLLFVPSLDREAAQAAAAGCTIVPITDTENPFEVLRSKVGATLGTMGVEKKDVSFWQYERLRETFPDAAYTDVQPFIMGLRLKKTPQDIAYVTRAVQIIEQVVEHAFTHAKIGMTEAELTAELEYQMRVFGADAPGFDTIVLAGKNAALPHGKPGAKKLEENDFLLLDMGVVKDGYYSDITRTFIMGEGTDEQVRIYETVREANQRAIDAVAVGKPLATIDRAAREYIESCGYGPYFNHRIGHGLGLEIHEEPSIHGENGNLIQPGLLFTIEPGIYLPQVGGVRIEDDVYITEKGEVQVITTYTKELKRIGC